MSCRHLNFLHWHLFCVWQNGTNQIKSEQSVDDGSAGMLIVILLFIIPSKPIAWPLKWISQKLNLKKEDPDLEGPSPGLIEWRVIHDRMPWGLVLLLGGGFALSKASKVSGLSRWMGLQLQVLQGLSPWLIITIICVGTALATELTSNVATASILMPILKNVAYALQINPLYLMIPTILTCSFAFMLPVATPPNAIVFTISGMKTFDMVTIGPHLEDILVIL